MRGVHWIHLAEDREQWRTVSHCCEPSGYPKKHGISRLKLESVHNFRCSSQQYQISLRDRPAVSLTQKHTHELPIVYLCAVYRERAKAKENVSVVIPVLKKAPRHEDVWGSEGVAPVI